MTTLPRGLVAMALVAGCASHPAPKGTTMTTDSASLARRYFDMWNHADVAAVDSLLSPDVVGHANSATLHGRETLKQRITALWAAYPTAAFAMDEVVATSDRAVIRWTFTGTNTGPIMGKPATGKQVRVTGMNMFRIADGQIAELWVSADDLGELDQLGLVELPR